MAILPKKRFGCLARLAKFGLVLLIILSPFIYWNFLREPALRISKETTYIIQPLRDNGSRVDYSAAIEQQFDLQDLASEDNGYRLIVRALGEAADDEQDEARTACFYAKMELDPTIKPALTYVETHEFLQEYCEERGLNDEQAWELARKVYSPWTCDDLAMLTPWLEQTNPVLDLVAEAVRKPVFRLPLKQADFAEVFGEAVSLGEWPRLRAFARMLQARANYRIGTGDIDGAVDDVITLNRLGRHLERQGSVLASLIGVAIQGIGRSVGVADNLGRPPTAEQLQRFLEQLDSLPPRKDIDRLLLVQRYHILDRLQALAHGDLPLADLAAGTDPTLEILAEAADYVSVDWNIVARKFNTEYDALEKAVTVTPPELLSPRDLYRSLFIGARSHRVADLVCGLCIPSVQATREAMCRCGCIDNLQCIALAMLLYERDHGTLPPAYSVDSNGKPLHSWRILLLPYLGKEDLYAKLKLDEPWDSEHNRRFHETPIGIYQCPSAELSLGQTNYSVVVGNTSAFQVGEGKSLADFGKHLVLVVERCQPICWMDPASEIDQATATRGINHHANGTSGIGSHHPGGMNAAFRGGGVRFVSETIERAAWQGLLDGTAEELP